MDETTTRWLHAFTHRRRYAAPNLDTLEACPDVALDAARFVWHRRVVNESRSVDLARRMQETQQTQQAATHTGALGEAFFNALVRLEEDETSHVDLATAVLKKLNAPTIVIPPDATTVVLPDESAGLSMMRLVLTGLCICESISAARFAAVREHTDLDGYRACIELFYRDELTHAELGFVMLPHIVTNLRDEMGNARADELVAEELRTSLGHMDRVVGLDFERKGGPPPTRPQPKPNPGVVEPSVDALAFYRSIHDDVLPRLESLGLDARQAWKMRSSG
jgi:hypothetical protein